MKISDIITEASIGRALWRSLGGQVDPKNPREQRRALQAVRPEIGKELYKAFMDEQVRNGILLGGGIRGYRLANPADELNVVSSAINFLSNAYVNYLDQPEVNELRTKFLDLSGKTYGFSALRDLFYRTNNLAIELKNQSEQRGGADLRTAIKKLATGIRNQFTGAEMVLRDSIKKLLSDLSSQSTYRVNFPFSNTLPTTIGTLDADKLKLYDEILTQIYELKNSNRLTLSLAKEFYNLI